MTETNDIIILTGKGTYKDGGSELYEDKNSNSYWINKKFGEKNTKYYNKLLIGNTNSTNRILARGTFKLKHNNQIIIQ